MSLGQFGFLYLSLEAGLPPGLAALVLQAQVIFTVVIAAVPLGERPTRPQVVGVALGVAGLVTVALGREATVPRGIPSASAISAVPSGLASSTTST